MSDITETRCPTPVGWFVSSDGQKIPAPCKSWSCPVCSQQKKNMVLDRIHDGQVLVREDTTLHQDFRFFRFLTLTQATDDDTPIMEAWARLRSYLLKCGYKLIYFGVKEFTRKGKRHLHILVNQYLPFMAVKNGWILATFGKSYRVWINRVDIKNAAGYMGKYMAKTLDHKMFLKGERRYFHSRGHYFKNHRQFKVTRKWRFDLDRRIDFDKVGNYFSNIVSRGPSLDLVEQARHNQQVRLSHGLVISGGPVCDYYQA